MKCEDAHEVHDWESQGDLLPTIDIVNSGLEVRRKVHQPDRLDSGLIVLLTGLIIGIIIGIIIGLIGGINL